MARIVFSLYINKVIFTVCLQNFFKRIELKTYLAFTLLFLASQPFSCFCSKMFSKWQTRLWLPYYCQKDISFLCPVPLLCTQFCVDIMNFAYSTYFFKVPSTLLYTHLTVLFVDCTVCMLNLQILIVCTLSKRRNVELCSKRNWIKEKLKPLHTYPLIFLIQCLSAHLCSF